MEAINAASRARIEALVEVRSHIIKFDRSLKKFEILKETQLVAYAPPSASASKATLEVLKEEAVNAFVSDPVKW